MHVSQVRLPTFELYTAYESRHLKKILSRQLGGFQTIQILFATFLILISIFLGSYVAYFGYVRHHAKKPWKLRINSDFKPNISILIPVHNEEGVIRSKLENIKNVSYPKEKIEMIVANDASEDRTLTKVRSFTESNSGLNTKIVGQDKRIGKSAILNKALAVSSNPIVIVSDADTSWSSNILQKALPYLAEPMVGAITGKGINRNTDQSWVAKGENTYLNLASLLRLGESKIHSTIRFEGGFCAFKKVAFEKFDCETGADDSGTALAVVQNNYRTLFVPEAVFFTKFPTVLTNKLKIKVRRANQLISLWVKCAKLMLEKRLLLPKRIVIPEIILFIFNPIILIGLIITGATNAFLFPFSYLTLAILLSILVLLLFVRNAFLEVLLDNMILLYALITFLFGRRYITWEKFDSAEY